MVLSIYIILNNFEIVVVVRKSWDLSGIGFSRGDHKPTGDVETFAVIRWKEEDRSLWHYFLVYGPAVDDN